MRRLCSLLLAFFLCCFPLISQAHAVPDEIGIDVEFSHDTSGQLGEQVFYTIDELRGTLTLTGSGPTWDFSLTTGSTGHGVPVFLTGTGMKGIHTLIVEEGITEIGDYVFYDFQQLIEAYLPDSLERIGSYAFSGCDSLRAVRPMDAFRQFGSRMLTYHERDYAFDPIYTFPEHLKEIGRHAFSASQERLTFGWTTYSSVSIYFLGDTPPVLRPSAQFGMDTVFAQAETVEVRVYYPEDASGWAASGWEVYPLFPFCGAPFADVPSGVWYGPAVASGYRSGLFQGDSVCFYPDAPVTASVTFMALWRASDAPQIKNAALYSGLAFGSPYFWPVVWARAQNLPAETETLETPLTRGELVRLLWQFSGCPAAETGTASPSFPDRSGDPAAQWAVSTGLLLGRDGRLALDQPATRSRAGGHCWTAFSP